jgi:PAS domain S-box-containing protein
MKHHERAEVEEGIDLADLRIREAELRLILDGVRDHAISLLDPAGHIITWNAAAEIIKGFTLDEVKGRYFGMLFIDEDQRAGVPERELEVARATGKFVGEGVRRRKDGGRFFGSMSLSALCDPEGALLGFVKVTRDITGEVELRARLARMHRLTAALAKAASAADVARIVIDEGPSAIGADSAALWLVDADAGVLRLARHHNVPTEFISQWIALPLDGDGPAASVVRSRRPLWVETAGDYEAASADIAARARAAGRLHAFSALPLETPERVLGVLSYGYAGEHAFSAADRQTLETLARDSGQALERASLLDAQVRANARLRLVVDAGALLSSSIEHEVTLANLAKATVPGFADWCAVDLVDADGSPKAVAIAHVQPEKVAYAQELRRQLPPRPGDPGLMTVLATGKPELYAVVTDEILVASIRDEHTLAIARGLGMRSVIIVPLVAGGRIFGAMTMVSTTEGRHYSREDLDLASEIARRAGLAVDHARLYEESREIARRASEASRLKDEFLATVSHELRTPLTALLGWARMLRTGHLSEEKSGRAIESIERNAVAQAQLVEDLLDISRIITGKLRLEVRSIDLVRVVEAAIESIRPALEAKAIRFEPILDPDSHAIMGDPIRLQQVVWNLLSNASKFTKRGGRVQVVLQRVDSHVELSVMDDGEGIHPDFLPFVFDRFRQADASYTRAHGGLGLGLAI